MFAPRRATALLGVTLPSSDIGRTLSAIVVGNSEGRERKRSFAFVYVGKAESLSERNQSPGIYDSNSFRNYFSGCSVFLLVLERIKYITVL